MLIDTTQARSFDTQNHPTSRSNPRCAWKLPRQCMHCIRRNAAAPAAGVAYYVRAHRHRQPW